MAKEIKLGAPLKIEGTQNAQASLSVQIMSRCKELTLAENATQEGSIATAARLLAQLRKEIEITESDGLGIISIGYDDNYTESIFNGHQVQLYAKSGDIIVDTTGKVWEIAEIVGSSDNANPQITPDGLFTIDEGEWVLAKVRLRISENDEECLDGDVILGLSEHPELGRILAEYPELGGVILEHPELAKIIARDTEIVHSILDTNKRRFIKSNGVSNSTFIELEQSMNDCGSQIEVEIKVHPVSNAGYIMGSRNWNAGAFLIHANGLHNYTYYCEKGSTVTDTDNFDILAFKNTSGRGSNTKITILGGCGNEDKSIECQYVKYRFANDAEVHLVPFISPNGNVGMIDLNTGKEYYNSGTGEFTIGYVDKNGNIIE